MSIQSIRNNIIFGCKGSLIDAIGKKIPNYSRANSMWLEDHIDNKLVLFPVESFNPAFRTENQYIYIEPGGTNKVLFNSSFDNKVWIKGSNISVRPNTVISPTGAREADRLLWGEGTGNSQVIRTKISLIAGETYHFSAYVKANTDNFESNDKIFIFGNTLEENVGDSEPIMLTALNNKVGEWVRLDGIFTPNGVSSENKKYLPNLETSGDGSYPTFNVSNFTSTTLTLFASTSVAIPASVLVGAQYAISKSGGIEIIYDIIDNTAFNQSSNSITITIDSKSGNPINDGINISDTGIITNKETVDFNIGIYVEKINSLDIAGVQVEERNFPTSMVFQYGEVYPKTDTRLIYEHSPIKDERNWAIYFYLNQWKGNGNIMDLGSLKIFINEDKQLVINGLNFLPYSISDLPSFGLLLEVDNIKLESRLYLDGVLLQQINLQTEFLSNIDDYFILSSQGLREFKDYIFFKQIIGSSDDIEGQVGRNDVEILFKEESILPLNAINYGSPTLVLPPVVIPPRLREKYSVPVLGVNYINDQITTSFSAGQKIINQILNNTTAIIQPEAVTIQRPELNERRIITIGYANAIALSISVDQYLVTLDSVKGIRTGDTLVFRDTSLSGRASVRFPTTAIDLQIIQSVEQATRKVTVQSVSSFSLSRALVTTDKNQDVGEVLIENIDLIGKTLTLNDIQGISIGHIIYQTKYEVEISRYNYFISLLDKIEGVRVEKTYSNGIVFSNDNEYEVKIDPRIRIFL